jgi:hypothetical protein
MWWISLPWATFGLIGERGGNIVEAPPIARWSVGKKASYVIRYYQDKGARIR